MKNFNTVTTDQTLLSCFALSRRAKTLPEVSTESLNISNQNTPSRTSFALYTVIYALYTLNYALYTVIYAP